MMAEEHPSIGRREIGAISKAVGRSRAPIIKHQDAASQETPVEPVGQHIKAGGRNDKPERIDLLIRPYNASHQTKGNGAQASERSPADKNQRALS
jgi:hypothetical protein